MRIMIEKSEFGNQPVCNDCGVAIEPLDKCFLLQLGYTGKGFYLCKSCMSDFTSDIEMLSKFKKRNRFNLK